MGYSSREIQQDNYDDEPMPNWALKLQQSAIPNNNFNCPHLVLDAQGMATVQVQNHEQSWEKYYAFIVGGDVDALSSISITVKPRVGMLAARGGVNYYFLDQAQLKLTIKAIENLPLPGNCNCWLLVGTEEEHWFYKLMI
jgi:hypothetical protein